MSLFVVGALGLSASGCVLFFDLNRDRSDLEPGDVAGRAVTADGPGSPVAFARVDVLGTVRHTRAQADGRFLVRGLQEGGWLVRLVQDDEAPYGRPERTAIQPVLLSKQPHGLFGGEAELIWVDLGDVPLSGPATVEGAVEFPDRSAVPTGARIYVYRDNTLPEGPEVTTSIEATTRIGTDDNGFSVGGLTPGAVQIFASLEDGDEVRVSQVLTRQIAAGSNEPVSLVLDGVATPPEEGVFLTFVPTLPTGHEVQVSLLAHGTPPGLVSPEEFPPTALTVDEDGRIDLTGLPVGALDGGELSVHELLTGTVVDVFAYTDFGGQRLQGAGIGAPIALGSGPITLHPVELTDGLCVPDVGFDRDGETVDCDGDTFPAAPQSPEEQDALADQCLAFCEEALAEDPIGVACEVDGELIDCDDDGDGVVDIAEGPCAGLPVTDRDGDGECGLGEADDTPPPPPPADGGVVDAGPDGGEDDAGSDGGVIDGGVIDAGPDGGVIDVDAGPDGGATDGGHDAGLLPDPELPEVSPGAALTIASTDSATCLVRSSVPPFCWGAHRQAGAGEDLEGGRPWAEPAGLAEATVLGAGSSHFCAWGRLPDPGGQGMFSVPGLHCWGENGSGQLGLDVEAGDQLSPTYVALPSLTRVEAIEGGVDHTCVILEPNLGGERTVLCFGANGQSQLGYAGPAPTDASSGTQLSSFDGAPVELALGHGFSCGRTDADKVYCWGANDLGQAGQADDADPAPTVDAPAEVALPDEGPWLQLAAGARHACVRNERGDVYCWGDNAQGQLGDDTGGVARAPRLVSGVPPAAGLGAGDEHTCALSDLGAGLTCWGNDAEGQLAAEGGVVGPTAVDLGAVSAFSVDADLEIYAVHGGQGHTCALVDPEDGAPAVACFGRNASYQLGHPGGAEPGAALAPARTLRWTSDVAAPFDAADSYSPALVPGPDDAVVFGNLAGGDALLSGGNTAVGAVVTVSDFAADVLFDPNAVLEIGWLLHDGEGALQADAAGARVTVGGLAETGAVRLAPTSAVAELEATGVVSADLQGSVASATLVLLDGMGPSMDVRLGAASVETLTLVAAPAGAGSHFVFPDLASSPAVTRLELRGTGGALSTTAIEPSPIIFAVLDGAGSDGWTLPSEMALTLDPSAQSGEVIALGGFTLEGILDFTGATQAEIDGLTVTPTGTLGASSTGLLLDGPLDVQGAVDLAGTTLTCRESGALTYAGDLTVPSLAVASGANCVVEVGSTGSGLLVTGATIVDGTLTVREQADLGALTVSDGGTLLVDGQLITTTSPDLSPGASLGGPGILAVGDGVGPVSQELDLTGQPFGGTLLVSNASALRLTGAVGAAGSEVALRVEAGGDLLVDGGTLTLRELQVTGSAELWDVDVDVSGAPGTVLVDGTLSMRGGTLSTTSDVVVSGTLSMQNRQTPAVLLAAGSLSMQTGANVDLGHRAEVAGVSVPDGASLSLPDEELLVRGTFSITGGAELDAGRSTLHLDAPAAGDLAVLDFEADLTLSSLLLTGAGTVEIQDIANLYVMRDFTVDGLDADPLTVDVLAPVDTGLWQIEPSGARVVLDAEVNNARNLHPIPVLFPEDRNVVDAVSRGNNWGAQCGNDILEPGERCDEPGFDCLASCEVDYSNFEASECSWTGAVDSAWATAGNWSCGYVPESSDVALFAGTPQNDLVVSQTTSLTAGFLVVDDTYAGRIDISNGSGFGGGFSLTGLLVDDCAGAGCSITVQGDGVTLDTEVAAITGPLALGANTELLVRDQAVLAGGFAADESSKVRLDYDFAPDTPDAALRLVSDGVTPLGELTFSATSDSLGGNNALYALAGIGPVSRLSTGSLNPINRSATIAADLESTLDAEVIYLEDTYNPLVLDASLNLRVTSNMSLVHYGMTVNGDLELAGDGVNPTTVSHDGGALNGEVRVTGPEVQIGYAPIGVGGGPPSLVIGPGARLIGPIDPYALSFSAQNLLIDGGTFEPRQSSVTVSGAFRMTGGSFLGWRTLDAASVILEGGAFAAPANLNLTQSLGALIVDPSASFEHNCGVISTATSSQVTLDADQQVLWRLAPSGYTNLRFESGTSVTLENGMYFDGQGGGELQSTVDGEPFTLDARGDLHVVGMSLHEDAVNIGPGYVAADDVNTTFTRTDRWRTPATCGDGALDVGEECDSGAGCSPACTLLPTWTCSAPGTCTKTPAECGDGTITPGQEECDDGNLINGDGCSQSCTREMGSFNEHECYGCPSVCYEGTSF